MPLSKFRLFPSLGTAMHLSVLQFGKFLLFPLNFGSLAVKTMAFFKISSLFIIKSSVDHTSYKYCVLCMVKHKYFPISWFIGNKSSGNCQKFVIFTCFVCSIMCYVYSITKTYTISPLVWLVGCKCRGNYRNFDNFPSIICHLVKMVKPSL